LYASLDEADLGEALNDARELLASLLTVEVDDRAD
jgi:hypothetical protein